MRAKVVPLRDIHEKYRADVKPFTPSFVIPRHAPGWERMEGEARGLVFVPAAPQASAAPVAARPGRGIDVTPRR